MTEVNEKILRLAKERDWSIYELAQRADITHSTLNSFLNRNTPPKLDTLQRICNALGVSLAQFFLEDEHMELLSEDERVLVARYRRMEASKQRALLDLL